MVRASRECKSNRAGRLRLAVDVVLSIALVVVIAVLGAVIGWRLVP
jgi:hypothetical protein